MATPTLCDLLKITALCANGTRCMLKDWHDRAFLVSERVASIKLVHQSSDLKHRRCSVIRKWKWMGPNGFWRKLKLCAMQLLHAVMWHDCDLVWVDGDHDAICISSAECVDAIIEACRRACRDKKIQYSKPIVFHATRVPCDAHRAERDPIYPRIVHQVAAVYLEKLSPLQRRCLNRTLEYPALSPKSIEAAHRTIRRICDEQDQVMNREEEAERHAAELLRQEEEEARAAEAKREKRRSRKQAKKKALSALHCETADSPEKQLASPTSCSPSTCGSGAALDECSVCLDAPRDMMCWPCRHLCMCEGCALKLGLASSERKCPICSAACETTYRVYL